MKVVSSLYLILLAFCFLGCGDELNVLDIVDDVVSEQAGSAIPNWQYYPEKNITLNFPEWLKDGTKGKIGLGTSGSHGPDESFELEQWHSLFHEEEIYIPDRSATHIYVFDFDGNMLEDKTLSREFILGGRGSVLSPNMGNVTLDGKLKHKGLHDQSVADYVRSVRAEGNTLIVEIGWWRGHGRSWQSRAWGKSTTTHWDINTGEISFGREDDLDCWISWKDETGQGFTQKAWCEMVEHDTVRADIGSSYIFNYSKDGSYLLFSTEEYDYIYTKDTRGANNKWDGYKIITKEGLHIGYFNPDMLVHGRDDKYRFRHGIYHENTLYMLASTVPHNGIDDELGIAPYTFYAFQKN